MKALPDQIEEFKEGDTDILSSDRMNEIIRVTNAFLQMRAGPGIRILKSDSNIIIERTAIVQPANGTGR